MGRQIALLLTNKDLFRLDTILRKGGDTEFYLDREPDGQQGCLQPLEQLAMSEEDIGGASLFCVLAPAGAHWHLQIDQHGPLKRRVNTGLSDVVELLRPYCKDGIMRPGRLWYEPNPWINGAIRPKSATHIRWANRVLARARRSLSPSVSRFGYAGPDAAAKIASGEIVAAY